jgi:hypothetical protein
MTTLVEALQVLNDLTKTREPMVTFITREVNLYLDVLRIYGKRDKLSETDVHILVARLLDLAQIGPLAEPGQGDAGVAKHVDAIEKQVQSLTAELITHNEPSPVVKMYAPKKAKVPETQAPEVDHETRL